MLSVRARVCLIVRDVCSTWTLSCINKWGKESSGTPHNDSHPDQQSRSAAVALTFRWPSLPSRDKLFLTPLCFYGHWIHVTQPHMSPTPLAVHTGERWHPPRRSSPTFRQGIFLFIKSTFYLDKGSLLLANDASVFWPRPPLIQLSFI